jgi:hypothetical protein
MMWFALLRDFAGRPLPALLAEPKLTAADAGRLVPGSLLLVPAHLQDKTLAEIAAALGYPAPAPAVAATTDLSRNGDDLDAHQRRLTAAGHPPLSRAEAARVYSPEDVAAQVGPVEAAS